MRKIRVKDIKDEMVLLEPLKTSAGVVLMAKGTVLREAFVPRLVQRGVTTVCVEGEPQPGDMAEEHDVSDIQKIPLEKLFERKLVNSSMNIIYEALARHRNSSGV
ncbi:MAG: hypothetical protein LBC85_01015 [Fibromonadaceae bacterium]|jgi:hypothetical protein|nr:hypothetical protein [Fibromonadaceae bacterium]